MSAEPEELIALPFIIVVGLAIVAAVWIGGNGGDISWISDVVQNLTLPAIVVGLLIAAGAAIINAL
ncbi:hypothetical protein LPA44_15310 [Halobacterium sp. KA-4]|uniref:hypothetical protein n=1 Tax=Halobacterium sp. KA-4 TaxID=2896367 RepID=UPI001E579313|nr:hypothetical protein [Halobacterium sp. KA-4]MCD2201241.1 hypothetical protein [Halobacterium sp. KA-4]